MKNIYHTKAFNECAEIRVFHKLKNYSFMEEKTTKNIENAVEYTNAFGGNDHQISLKEYNDTSLTLIYEYNVELKREQLEELLVKDLQIISKYLYAVTPKIRTLLHEGRTYIFRKNETQIII